jgi:hypothetical protein
MFERGSGLQAPGSSQREEASGFRLQPEKKSEEAGHGAAAPRRRLLSRLRPRREEKRIDEGNPRKKIEVQDPK